jgi:hypothetical protein
MHERLSTMAGRAFYRGGTPLPLPTVGECRTNAVADTIPDRAPRRPRKSCHALPRTR